MKLLIIFVTSAVLLQYHFAATAPGQEGNEHSSLSQLLALFAAATSGQGEDEANAEPEIPLKKEVAEYYQPIKQIFKGEFIRVILVRHKRTKEEVVIKIINKLKPDLKNDKRKLYNEGENMKKLNHPYIVRLHHIIDTKDELHLVMEYASGGDMYENLKRCGSIQEEKARFIFRQMFSAILYCHQNNIAHQ